MNDKQLPAGWASGRFGELWTLSQNGCGVRRGKGTPTIVLRLADVTIEGRIAEDGLREIPLSDGDREKYALAKGDLLAFRVNGSPQITGQVFCYQGRPGSAFCDHFIRFRIPEDCLDARFVAYAFRVPPCRSQVARAMVSTAGQNTVSQKSFSDVQLPVPPLPEQGRIAEAIESYFTRLDDAVATLERVQRNLKRYRASVLKAAVEGRLVPTEAELARAEGRDYEPASVLLERILAERRRRWYESGARGKYKEPVATDPTDPPKLPTGWYWATVDQVLDNHDHARVPVKRADRARRQGNFAYYGASGVIDTIDDYLFDGSYLLLGEDGANLLARSKPIAFQAHGKFWVNNHAHVFQTYLDLPLAFMEVFFNAIDLGPYVTGTAQPKLPQAAMNKVPVPLPPAAEQERIVEAVEQMLSVAHEVEYALTINQRRCARLRQSILKWAFEGKLAEQDSSDEPASVLLERIRSETAVSRQSASKRARR